VCDEDLDMGDDDGDVLDGGGDARMPAPIRGDACLPLPAFSCSVELDMRCENGCGARLSIGDGDRASGVGDSGGLRANGFGEKRSETGEGKRTTGDMGPRAPCMGAGLEHGEDAVGGGDVYGPLACVGDSGAGGCDGVRSRDLALRERLLGADAV
jgi:hypothetical protein